ncbi:MAG: glycosyltransferase [Stellaceae bacterium]
MVRAYRDQKRFDHAEALARQGLGRFPAETFWPLLLALVLADQNPGEILESLAAGIAPMRVVRLAKNQGKATAMNVGALLARHQLLALIDGDALLDPYALPWIAWTFRRPDIGALTGNPRIRNRTTILGRLQVGEFSSIIGLIKRTHATYGRMFAVSGVICALRKQALHQAGWWSPHTLTDDVDVTWRIQRAGWRIAYQPNAIVWILMPETLRGLWRQRLRWAEGGGQMLLDNAGPMLRGNTPSLLPVYLDAVTSIVWSYCVLATLLLAALHGIGIRVLPTIPTFSLVPEWYGLTLCLTFLLQALVSTSLETRLERGLRGTIFGSSGTHWRFGRLMPLPPCSRSRGR